jgi:hypothetical protein
MCACVILRFPGISQTFGQLLVNEFFIKAMGRRATHPGGEAS